MKLKIITPDKLLFEWEVKEAIIPTNAWELCILPEHAVYSWIVQWWICKFKLTSEKESFITKDDYSIVSIGNGIAYTDGEFISIVVSSADSKIDISLEKLEEMKQQLDKEIEQIKIKWSVEEVEKAMLQMNKILADIELSKL
jgi:F0F1-type ATP synthase epsilon subunit